jgi:hypothetical protein
MTKAIDAPTAEHREIHLFRRTGLRPANQQARSTPIRRRPFPGENRNPAMVDRQCHVVRIPAHQGDEHDRRRPKSTEYRRLAALHGGTNWQQFAPPSREQRQPCSKKLSQHECATSPSIRRGRRPPLSATRNRANEQWGLSRASLYRRGRITSPHPCGERASNQ